MQGRGRVPPGNREPRRWRQNWNEPMRKLIYSCVLMVGAWAFATQLQAGETASDPSGPTTPAEEVREAERAFANALKRRDREAFAGYIADDAVFFGGQSPHHGPAEVLEAWSSYFQADGPRLSWEPAKVEVNEQRSLATTTGPYTLTITASGEKLERMLHGTYFSVWTRTATGDWQVIFDTGTSPGERRPDQGKSGG